MNTCTVDRQTFEELPDRNGLTGMPMPNQFYRDSAHPEHVFKWAIEPGAHEGAWQTFLRIEP